MVKSLSKRRFSNAASAPPCSFASSSSTPFFKIRLPWKLCACAVRSYFCCLSASEERTPSTCVSCRSTRARLYRSSNFCEQNCFSDFTNNCNNLFFFRSLSHSTLLSMSLRHVSPAERDMEDLRDSRHRPYCTVGVFFVPRFFLCLHQQRQRPVFLQLALTIDRYILL